MHLIKNPFTSLLPVLALPLVAAASSWGFTDATVSVTSKGQGVGGGLKEKYIARDYVMHHTADCKPTDFPRRRYSRRPLNSAHLMP